MKAIEKLKRLQGFAKDNGWYKEGHRYLSIALHFDSILAELQSQPEKRKETFEDYLKLQEGSMSKWAFRDKYNLGYRFVEAIAAQPESKGDKNG